MEVDRAITKLAAYERAVRAVLDAQGVAARPPVLRLDDTQLGALFAPRQLAALVRKPLERPQVDCGDE